MHILQRNRLRIVFILVVVSFALVGTVLLWSSLASPATAKLEPEQGSVTAPAVGISDTSASSGGAVRFQAATTDPGYAKPAIGTRWQWQLTGTVNETVLDSVSGPKMYDIDMENASAALISRLKAKGIYVICYVESGDWSSGRPDAGDYAPAILGKTINGFPDEKFVNINALDSPAGPTGKTLRQIMMARLDRAKAKGCDGIEPDLDDLHAYNTGFTITQANQVAYNTVLIQAAHARGMSMGLKNGADGGGAGSFTKAMFDAGADWVVNEECNQYTECGGYAQFIAGGRPVFQVEYLDNQLKPYSGATGTCAKNNAANFDGIVKDSSSILAATPLIQCR